MKGSAADDLRPLGPLASVAKILISMKGKYGVAVSYDSVMRDFYTLNQEKRRKVPQFTTQDRNHVVFYQMEVSQGFVCNVESNALRDRISFGLQKGIRDSIIFRYNDPPFLILSYLSVLGRHR